MIEHYKKLFEFVCNLIPIQIKKYTGLATIGIGPDARMNSSLVINEVNELLMLANTLLKRLESNEFKTEDFIFIFKQIKFYMVQEYLRAYSGWLLDENTIHNPMMLRINDHLESLEKIAKSAGIGCPDMKPETAIQAQCEHDSNIIAYYILDLAKKLKNQPEMELDDNIPAHARKILRKNAFTRYAVEEFEKPICELHESCEKFLKTSTLEKSTTQISRKEAIIFEERHKKQWLTLVDRYKKISPSSTFTQYESYKIVDSRSETKSNFTLSFKNRTLLGGAAVLSALVIYMLMPYFSKLQEENSLGSIFKL